VSFLRRGRASGLYYFFAVGVFALLKLWFSFADTEDFLFLIKPASFAVGAFFGSQAVYTQGAGARGGFGAGDAAAGEAAGERLPAGAAGDAGFFHPRLGIVIGKSCSGLNFFVLAFCLLYFRVVGYSPKNPVRLLAVPACLAAAWFVTLCANTSRIVCLVFFGLTGFSGDFSLMHKAVGACVYVFFLAAAYLSCEYALRRCIR
jgi:exosortase K